MASTLCGALVLAGAAPAVASASARPADSYGLDAPSSVAVVGSDLFVTNEDGNTVTEVNASSGGFVASISGPGFDFDQPTAIIASGKHLFVANGAGNSVTEFDASSRQLIRTINATAHKLSDPIAMTVERQKLFVLNSAGSVTEVSTTNGELVGVTTGSQYGFDTPTGIAVAGHVIYVTNSDGNSVTEISTSGLGYLGTLSGPSYGFSEPTGAAVHGKTLWVTNTTGQSVTEISTKTGQATHVVVNTNLAMPGPITYGDGYMFTASPPGSSPMISQITASTSSVNWMMCNTNGPYVFNDPQSLVVAGSDLWVINEGGNSMTQMHADSGDFIQVVS
ncbi:MAG: PQQ-binding-like beta-propeller repeat protein [Acidimicrobiales bacterium]